MKSKNRATKTTSTTIAKGTSTGDIGFSRLGVFENDVADHLDNVLTLVSDRFHQLIDLLQLDDRYRIIGLEERCDRLVENHIGLVLQPVHFDDPALHLGRLDLLNASKSKVDLLHGLHHYVREPPHGL